MNRHIASGPRDGWYWWRVLAVVLAIAAALAALAGIILVITAMINLSHGGLTF